MEDHDLLTLARIPDPLERAARVDLGAAGPRNWLGLAPASLSGALICIIGRDVRGFALSGAQRLSHFPASPIVAISWYHGIRSGLVERGPQGPAWLPFGADVVVSGSQSHPTVTWAQGDGCGYMACFTADAAHALFGVDIALIQDRFVPAEQVIDATWSPLWQALRACTERDIAHVLEAYLASRWMAVQGRTSPQASLRQLGRSWVERLGWQAREWGRSHSPRHVERRIKSLSGRSLREWQALVRTEGLFFAARDRHEAGQPYNWAELAQDQGFADQAHMSRATKRITGFSPTEFAQRFVEDESFWMYRLWV